MEGHSPSEENPFTNAGATTPGATVWFPSTYVTRPAADGRERSTGLAPDGEVFLGSLSLGTLHPRGMWLARAIVDEQNLGA